MPAWNCGGNRKLLERENLAVRATERSVAFGGNSINSPITIGVDEERIRQNLRDEISGLAEVKGLPEAPLRAVLEKLSRNHVSEEEIPTRLAAAADELLGYEQTLHASEITGQNSLRSAPACPL